MRKSKFDGTLKPGEGVRQGDFYIEKVSEVPELESTPLQSLEGPSVPGLLIIGLGEATGHRHAILVDQGNAKMFKAINSDKVYLMVEKDTFLTHDTHGKIPLKKGPYEIVKQQEKLHGRVRAVAD
jgi:hypothetical protein